MTDTIVAEVPAPRLAVSQPRIASDELLANFGLVLPEGHFWSHDDLGAVAAVRIEDDPDGWIARIEDCPSVLDGPAGRAWVEAGLLDSWDEAWAAENTYECRQRRRQAPLLTPEEEAQWQRISDGLHDLRAAEDLAVTVLREQQAEGLHAPEGDALLPMGLEDYLGLPGVLLTVVNPRGKGKRPLVCFEHAPCKRFWLDHECITNAPTLLRSVLAHHPDALVGIVPTGDLLVADVDSRKALRALKAATGIDLREHLVIKSPRGWHIYMRAPQALRSSSLHSGIPGVDLRYARASIGNYVVAPQQSLTRLRKGVPTEVTYEVLYGQWSSPAPAPESFLEVFGWKDGSDLPGGPPRCALRVNRWDLTGPALDAAVASFVERAERLADAYEQDPLSGTGVETGEQRSDSARLMACWRIAQWTGLTPEQAVKNALTYGLRLAVRITSGARSREWGLLDAKRVYERPHLVGGTQKPRVAWDGSEGHQRIAGTVQKNSRLPEVWDQIVALVQAQQRTDHLGIGVEQLADALGASKMAASKWLKQLGERGLLEMSEDYVFRFDPRQRAEQNRVREFTVYGVSPVLNTETAVAQAPVPTVWTEMALAA